MTVFEGEENVRECQITLIHQVYLHPAIYSGSGRGIQKRRDDAWRKILACFCEGYSSYSVDRLKREWGNLRDYYAICVKGKSGYTNFWAREIMCFLGNKDNFGTATKTKAAVPLVVPINQQVIEEFENEQLEDLTVEVVDKDTLIRAAKTSMSSKLIGIDTDTFAEFCIDAIEFVKTIDPKSKETHAISDVSILKVCGNQVMEQYLIPGYALHCTHTNVDMPREVIDAKIACLDFEIDNVLTGKMIKCGTNVVLTTGKVDDSCLKQFTETGVAILYNLSYIDLMKLSNLTGAKLLSSFADAEQFDACLLGSAEEVAQTRIFDTCFISIKTKKPSASVILSGETPMLDEMERSLREAFYVVERVLKSKKFKKLSPKWCVDTKFQSAGTYALVHKNLHTKLLKLFKDKNDSSRLTECIVGFGMVFACSYEERLALYRKNRGSSIGGNDYAMIKLRTWTPSNELPVYAKNCGDAAYYDEAIFHNLPLKFNDDFFTVAGSPNCRFTDLDVEKTALRPELQNQMARVLIDSLLNPKFVDEKIRCPSCDHEGFTSVHGFSNHLSALCEFKNDPYAQYRSVNWEEMAKIELKRRNRFVSE